MHIIEKAERIEKYNYLKLTSSLTGKEQNYTSQVCDCSAPTP